MINKENNVIYGLIDPNTKELRYIGYAKNMHKRFNQHHRLCALKKNNHKNNWIKSLLNNDQKAELIIIERCSSSEELPQAEIDIIAYFKSIGCNLTNGTLGGQGSFGVKNFLGKHHSQEVKNQISKSNKGQKRTAETKKNISESKIGKPSPRLGAVVSEETLVKMSEAAKGNKNWLGKTHSEVSKNKVAAANKGRFKNKSWSVIDGKRVWSDK